MHLAKSSFWQNFEMKDQSLMRYMCIGQVLKNLSDWEMIDKAFFLASYPAFPQKGWVRGYVFSMYKSKH